MFQLIWTIFLCGVESQETTRGNLAEQIRFNPFRAQLETGHKSLACQGPDILSRCVYNSKIDVIFLIDSSDATENLNHVKELIKTIASCLDISATKSHVSLLRYRRQVNVGVTLRGGQSRDRLFKYLQSMKTGLSDPDVNDSFLGRAFKYVHKLIHMKSFGRRLNVPTLLILITRQSSLDQFEVVQKKLAQKGVKIVTVGYGNYVTRAQLSKTISGPEQDNLLMYSKAREVLLATNSLLSAACEQNANYPDGIESVIDYNQLKKTQIDSLLHVESISILGPVSITATATFVKVVWSGSNSNLVTGYTLDWIPQDGKIAAASPLSTTRIIRDLQPGTIYALSITPNVKRQEGKVKTIIFTTEPNPLERLTVSTEDCVGESYNPMVSVQWASEMDDSEVNIKFVPEGPVLEASLEESERRQELLEQKRFFTLVTPGEEYNVKVNKWSIKNVQSNTESRKIVIPPLEPSSAEIAEITKASVRLKIAPPKTGVFDYFVISVRSAYGHAIFNYSVEEQAPTEQFYDHILNQLRPGSHYNIKIYTMSHGVRSRNTIMRHCTTLSPDKEIITRNLLMTGSKGVCSISIDNQDVNCASNLPDHLLRGVVSSVFFEHWSPNQGVTPYMIYAKPREHEIKITSLNAYGGGTTTVVDGLDMPFGLTIDHYGHNLYWTDQGTHSIGVASIKSAIMGKIKANRRLIHSKYRGVPRYIAVDPIRRTLIWSERNDRWERIHKSDVMGKGQQFIWHKVGEIEISGLSISLADGRICWVNEITKQLESIDQNGDDYKVVAENVSVKGLWMAIGSLSTENTEKYEAKIRVLNMGIIDALEQIGDLTWVDFYDGPMYSKEMLQQKGDLFFPCAQQVCDEVCIPDHLDSAWCTGTCQPWEWLCPLSNVCIPKTFVCDGYDDCFDGEDEIGTCPYAAQCDPQREFVCDRTQKCIDANAVCDGKQDCRDNSDEVNCDRHYSSCKFDHGICSWDMAGDFDWKITHGPTPSKFTGPWTPRISPDDTESEEADLENRYLYIEATEANEGERAILYSSQLKHASCLSFYYFMHGDSMGTLRVFSETTSQDISTIWEKSGDQGQYWQFVSLTVNPKENFYQIGIEAVRGRTYKSDIAIDDLIIDDGICPTLPSCSFNSGQNCRLKMHDELSTYYHWKHEFGKIIPPSLSRTSEIVQPDWQTGSTGKSWRENWRIYDFIVDQAGGCADECIDENSVKFARRLSAKSKTWVGVILCNNKQVDEYKIMLSDSLEGVFRHIVHPSTDEICKLLDSTSKPYMLTTLCTAELAYKQQYDGSFRLVRHNESDGFRTAQSYFCENSSVPKLTNVSPEYHYLIASAWGTGSKKPRIAIFSYPIVKPENATYMTNEMIPQYWCLSLTYSIIFNSELLVSINGNLLWSSEGTSTGPYRGQVTLNIPEPLVAYDITFAAFVQQGKSGAVLVDELTTSNKPCYQRRKKCTFLLERDINNCFFSLNRGQLTYEYKNRLFEKGAFDPDILSPIYSPSYIITIDTVRSVIYKSDHFFIGKPYYNEYCVRFRYQQRTSGKIMVTLDIGNDEGGTNPKPNLLYEKFLRPSPSKIYPWIDVAVPVVIDGEKYPLGAFGAVSYHSLYETFLSYIEIQNGKCETETCNGLIMCNNGKSCVEPYQLCDTNNDCDDWSDEIGCASGCGDQSEHYSNKGSLGTKPERSSVGFFKYKRR